MFIGWLGLATAKIDEWPANPLNKEPIAPVARPQSPVAANCMAPATAAKTQNPDSNSVQT